MKTLQKLTITTLLFLVAINGAKAQSVAIGEREFTPHPSAILEMQSTNKGMLIPRVTFTQRAYIQTNAQAVGLLVYQTDREAGFYYFDGLVWQYLAPPETTELPNLARVATTGQYEDLLGKPILFSGRWEDLQNRPTVLEQLPEFHIIATTGRYDDLENRPFVPTELRHLQQDDWWAMYVTRAEKELWNSSFNPENRPRWDDIQGRPSIEELPNLHRIATTGRYDDLENKPAFHQIATTGSWNDLRDRPAVLEEFPELHRVAATGSWNDLENRPTIPTELRHLQQDDWWAMYVTRAEKERWDNKADISDIPTHLRDLQQDDIFYMTVTRAEKDRWNTFSSGSTFSGSWNDLQDRPHFATVATTGQYEDLLGKPTLFPGRWEDLQNIPDFHRVATSGSYDDLIGTPSIPRHLEDMIQNSSFRTATDVEKERWNSKSDFSGRFEHLQGIPDFHTVATSGSYDDLTSRPTIPTTLAQLQSDQFNQRVSASDIIRWDNKSDFGGRWQDLDGRPDYANFATTLAVGTPGTTGTSNSIARGDHTHTIDLSELGAAPENHTHTPADIGAAAAQHTHTISTLENNASANQIANSVHTQDVRANNYTIVNTEMLHTVLTEHIGGNGDITALGFQTNTAMYQLNIKNNVELRGRPTLAQSSSTLSLIDRDPDNQVNHIATVNHLMWEIANLQTEITTLKTNLETQINTKITQDQADARVSRQMPQHAIIMWNRTDLPQPSECWEEIHVLAGRFPVGAGNAQFDDGSGIIYSVGNNIDNFNVGGQNRVALQTNQMPRHQHVLKLDRRAHTGGTASSTGPHHTRSSDVTDMDLDGLTTFVGGDVNAGHAAGNGLPHENRPPFYAVRFFQNTCP
ncbi:MAG: hypothetical protein FWG79_09715 [Bacteroidales bacterium]|nr:hypothetical protein [Bacteroidales bacterium]